MIRTIDRSLLAAVTAEAQAAPRLRKNRNFHPHDAYPAHRLLNAVEPGSYVIPHCHLDPEKDETMICLSGRLGIVIFSASGAVLQTVECRHDGATLGVDIPHGVIHTVLALESGTVFLESKSGPYRPLDEAEIPVWAAAEGSAAAAQCWQDWRRLFP